MLKQAVFAATRVARQVTDQKKLGSGGLTRELVQAVMKRNPEFERLDGIMSSLAEACLNPTTKDMVKVIGVCSATQGEGKTTVALGLATALARRSGSDVLLIEGDLANPTLAEDLQRDPSPGLVECLQLEEASIALDESEQALASYQGTLSPTAAIDPLSPTAAIDSDPELAALQGDARQAQRDYGEQLGRLEDIYLQRDAALQGRDLSFQVMDPPILPSSPLPTPRKDLLMLPALGMLLGVSASGAVLFALTRLDDSIRLPGEARQVGAPVLAVVPELGRRRVSSWPKHFVRLVVAASRGLIGNLR